MTHQLRTILMFVVVFGLIAITGQMSSWNVALGIINMGLISAIMALGVNMQWGYAGLFNIGVMGFVALGGLGRCHRLNAAGGRGLGGGWRARVAGAGSRHRHHRRGDHAVGPDGQGTDARAGDAGLADRGLLPVPRHFRPGGRCHRGGEPRWHRLSRWPRPADPDCLASRWRAGGGGGVDRRQDRPWPALGLPCHRDAWDRRDHHRGDEERGLAEPWRQERRRRTAQPDPVRDRSAKHARLRLDHARLGF